MNNESVLSGGISTLIRNNVLTPIVHYLATKGCQVSVEELSNLLKLAPTTAPAPNLTAPNMNFSAPMGYPPVANAPPTLTGFAGMPLPMGPTTGKGRGKGSVAVDNVPDNEKCQYIVTRGRNKNQRCTSRAEPNQPFCAQCKTKKAAQAQLQTGAQAPMGGSFPGMSGMNTMPGLPGLSGISAMPGFPSFAPTGTMSQLNPTISSALSAPPDVPKVQVTQLGDGGYHEKTQNLYLRAVNGGHVCDGVYDPLTGNISALTPDKIAFCKQNNINYVDRSNTNNMIPVSSVSGQTLASINQQLPGINTLSSVQQFGLPQVPNLNGMGSFAGLSAVTDHRGIDDP
jgi:hypothetical protein